MQHGGTADWFNWALKWGSSDRPLRDRWQCVRLGIRWPWPWPCSSLRCVQPRLTFSRNLAFSALVLLAGFLVLPRIVFGSAYADMRLVPFMIATALLAIRFRGETVMPTARTLAWVGLGFYLLRIATTTLSLALAANDQSAKLAALDHVPRGARLVSLVGQDCGGLWALPRNTHLPAMAIVRRHAFSNDQWAIEGANLLSVRYRQAGHFIADPSQIVRPPECASSEVWSADHALAAIPRDAFDYVWLIDMPPHDPRLLNGMTPIWRGQGSLLYAVGNTGGQLQP